ncbi:MFS transporter, partial [Escherichia coli]|nr:MFS transporter [Escherichia coli]
GILVDRRNRIVIMIALVATFVAGTLLTAVAPGVWTLFVGRMLTGIGTTGALTAALSLCADLCAPTQRGRALLVVNLGKSLGQAMAFGLTGALFGLSVHKAAPDWLSYGAPWRSAHLALAVIGVVVALPLFLMREPPRHEVAASTHAPFRIVVAELWARRAF